MKTKELYDNNAKKWLRLEASSLSDFTAREEVFRLCGDDLTGVDVYDIGCGEGYCARELASRGAKNCTAIDISKNMIEAAIIQNKVDNYPIQYNIGSASNFNPNKEFDLAIAIFLFNYLTVSEMLSTMKTVYNNLRKGGRFIFTVPHPFFPFLHTKHQPPFYFDSMDKDYFSSKDEVFNGEIWKSDGTALPVQCVHKKIDDYFSTLSSAGFEKIALVKELTLTKNMPENLYNSSKVLENKPLHMLFMVEK